MGFFGSLFESGGKPAEKLIEASTSGVTEKVKSVLAEGADVNVRDQDGWTALMHASWHGHSEVVGLLLNKGADVNAKASNGGTALMYASSNRHSKVAELLERHKAR